MLGIAQRRVLPAFWACFAVVAAHAQERRPVDVPARSRVFGRVVDEAGKPLANALATLHLVDDEWAKGVGVPKIRWRGYEVEAFQTRTGADGRFEFDVVTPTADWVSLFIEPDVYHDVADRNFGPAGGRDEPRLVVGDNDLGQFVLAAMGAISGRVIDAQAQPIAGADVRLDGSFPGGLGRGARSDATGAFTIERVPAGKYGLEALRDGFKLAKRAALEVRVRETAAAGDITLEISPTISGVVADEHGQPIVNARVWGWPAKSGTGSGAVTDAQGRFSVALKQADAHIFEVEAAGFAKLEEGFGAVGHPVGATDVRLVMKRPVMTTFVVLDAATSQPVTRFSVALAWRPRDGGSRSGGEPSYPLADHANGEFDCEADPALFDYVISAPGYGPAKGQVAHESSISPRCVVKLATEAALRGRVTLDGKPVPRAELVFYADSLARYHQEEGSGGGVFDEQSYYWDDFEGPRDLLFVLPQPSRSMTGPDGALEFAGLAAGKYRLEIWGPSGSRKSLDPLVVSASRSLELGDIALVPGSNLEGSVIVPYEIDPSTIKLRCWSMARDSSAQVKADHSFRFEGLAAGTAHVTVEEAFGLVRWGTLARVQLEPGQTQRVTLDLNDRVSVAAKLHVLVNGKPARGVRVFLKTGSGEGRERMNETDASGTSTGNVRALGPVDVTLLAPSGMNLGRFEGKLDLAVGSRPEATIEVSCAALEVEWPPLPADERLYSVVIDANPDSEEEGLTAHTMPHAEPPSTDAYVVGERRARFDWMPSGDLEWTIDVQTFDGRGARAYHKFRRQIRLAATGTTLVELTEADRVQER